MTSRTIHDIYDGKKLYIIAGSTEKLVLHIKNAKNDEPYSLKKVDNIIWRISPFSVLPHHNYAVVEKKVRVEYTHPIGDVEYHTVNHESWVDNRSNPVGRCVIKYTYDEVKDEYTLIERAERSDNTEDTPINDIVITDIEHGIIELTIRGSDTINLCGGFKHQIILVADAGKRFIPFNGVIMIDKCISEYK